MITIDLTNDDRLQTFLAAIAGSSESKTVRTGMGVEVTDQVKEHLYEKDKTPNRLGGKRSHFYRQAGDATSYELTAEGAVVSVNREGIRQQLEGGIITPKEADMLTIPVHEEAHNKRAGEFPNLFPIDGALARQVGEDGIEVLYILTDYVDQDPDPTVMPSDNEIAARARQAVFRAVDTILQSGGNP